MSFQYQPNQYRYPSIRRVVYGRKGMVCTAQPLAAQAGLDMMKQGGNAIDAAIATAAALTVLEPTSNGIGSDAFALVWVKDKLHGLNASGLSPAAFDVELVRQRHGDTMPSHGWVPVTVPGAPGAWAELHSKFGKLPFAQCLAPAIDYARNGYPVSPVVASFWNLAVEKFTKLFGNGAEFQNWFTTFAPQGVAPKAGELVCLKDHANTLEEIANTKAESFYRGALAEKIDAFSRKTGGFLRKEDMANFKPTWVEPISTTYRGYTVSEIPPNGHGIVALMALNILEGFSFSQRETTDSLHKQIEAMKLAFVDGQRYVADPRYMTKTPAQMLSKDYASARRNTIGDQALLPEPGDPASGGTVYLCTADEEGNMVSFIQSNYMGFGSGIVIPDTGISLQNRGKNFSLDASRENCAAPSKQTYHTIIPGFLSKDGKPIGPFGVMGGFMQPQGHVQVVMNMVDFAMNPQEALDAPRWQWTGGKRIELEQNFPHTVIEDLVQKGHEVTILTTSKTVGRGQMIFRNEQGVLVGATEPRADGMVAAW